MKNIFERRKVSSIIAVSFVALFGFMIQPKEGRSNIVGTSAFQDSIWIFNEVDWSVVNRAQLTLAGFTVLGANSISWNPDNTLFYAILRVDGFPRRLVTVVPETGVCTDIGNLRANFSSMTFSPGGTCLCNWWTGFRCRGRENLYGKSYQCCDNICRRTLFRRC